MKIYKNSFCKNIFFMCNGNNINLIIPKIYIILLITSLTKAKFIF